jgi:hypothetical protein
MHHERCTTPSATACRAAASPPCRRPPPAPPITRYPVRFAVVDLDDAPRWFKSSQARDHLTADQAREFAATDGVRVSQRSERPSWQSECAVDQCI